MPSFGYSLIIFTWPGAFNQQDTVEILARVSAPSTLNLTVTWLEAAVPGTRKQFGFGSCVANSAFK